MRLSNARCFSTLKTEAPCLTPQGSIPGSPLLTHLQYTSTAMRRTRHTKVKAETTIRGMIHSILPWEGRLTIPEVFFSAAREISQSGDRCDRPAGKA